MSAAAVIGVVAGAVVFLVLVVAIVVAVIRRRPGTLTGAGPAPHEASHEHEHDPGRGPTGQHPDPVQGTPSDTSTPHWDRRIDPNEGPQ